MKAFFVSTGWIIAASGLYAGIVAIEYYWNVPRWQPRMDWVGWLGLGWIGVSLFSAFLLAWVSDTRGTKVVAGLVCAALLSLAIYTVEREPSAEGLFGRSEPSPICYRAGRVVAMGLPGAFLAFHMIRQRRTTTRGRKRQCS